MENENTPIIEKNKVVSITYKITDVLGKVIEENNKPVSYLHGGTPRLFKKVESSLNGHKVGDKLYVTLSPSEAFGARNPSLVYIDNVKNVPLEYQRIGAQVEMKNEHGKVKLFIVTDINANTLTLDANHPMAGKTLTFKVQVTMIRKASSKEIEHGEPLTLEIGEVGETLQ